MTCEARWRSLLPPLAQLAHQPHSEREPDRDAGDQVRQLAVAHLPPRSDGDGCFVVIGVKSNVLDGNHHPTSVAATNPSSAPQSTLIAVGNVSPSSPNRGPAGPEGPGTART